TSWHFTESCPTSNQDEPGRQKSIHIDIQLMFLSGRLKHRLCGVNPSVTLLKSHDDNTLRVDIFISVSPRDGLLFRLTDASDWLLMENPVSQSALQPVS
ncbi:hypothetical protein KUCAC02_035041, partial [Chaenocephalus aceratus]